MLGGPFLRPRKRWLYFYRNSRNMNYQSYHLLAMILKFLLQNKFRLIRRLASEIEIMFLLEFVVFLEVWFKTCISTGSFMRLFKFVVTTSLRKKLERWQPCWQG
ncbi:hypothetical protein Cni_G22542 [Canna indica]|uniref:Uncharacterized protein n=1 Tax=Canna indica TaxID=4628 RepID=A0AAQ3KVB2_9LILI|nr:hypothetical protein Cni_G22542 [Canna indica]